MAISMVTQAETTTLESIKIKLLFSQIDIKIDKLLSEHISLHDKNMYGYSQQLNTMKTVLCIYNVCFEIFSNSVSASCSEFWW